MNEYFDIAETYGGTVVNMSTYTDNYVNPLEMDVWSLDPNDSKGMDMYYAEQIVLGAEDMKGVDFAAISESQLPSSLKENGGRAR